MSVWVAELQLLVSCDSLDLATISLRLLGVASTERLLDLAGAAGILSPVASGSLSPIWTRLSLTKVVVPVVWLNLQTGLFRLLETLHSGDTGDRCEANCWHLSNDLCLGVTLARCESEDFGVLGTTCSLGLDATEDKLKHFLKGSKYIVANTHRVVAIIYLKLQNAAVTFTFPRMENFRKHSS